MVEKKCRIDYLKSKSRTCKIHHNKFNSYVRSSLVRPFNKRQMYFCSKFQLNRHSVSIKDFWGVVVECKVMPGSYTS